MATTNEQTKNVAKSAVIDYVGNFLEKHERERRTTTHSETDTTQRPTLDDIVIRGSHEDVSQINLESHESGATEFDAEDLNLESEPVIETREGGQHVYKQRVFLRQYQQPTPDPVEIQVQEVVIKPVPQRPPLHVHVTPSQNRETQRTPSPIVIRSAPPPPPPADSSSLSSSGEPIVYNKFIPVDLKQQPQQIIIHRYPELPPKPRPIVVEQWLPNKPAPKRITYHHVNRDEYTTTEHEKLRNRFIEYKKPHTTVEVELVRLPIVKLKPEEYTRQSEQLTRINTIRSQPNDSSGLNWRI